MSQSNSGDEAEDDVEEFPLSLTASQIRHLDTILSYAAVELQNPQYLIASQDLLNEVNEIMASEEFNNALEDEVGQIMDQVSDLGLENNLRGHGVQ